MIEITYYAVFLVTLAVWILARVLIYKRDGFFSLSNELRHLLLPAYVLLIVRGIIFPLRSVDGRAVRIVLNFYQTVPPNINLVPFTFVSDFYPGWQVNVIGNIVAFIPLGLLFPDCLKKIDRFWKILLVGFGFTLLIETTQLFLTDRCSDVDDLILNTFGVAIGAAVFYLVKMIRNKQKV